MTRLATLALIFVAALLAACGSGAPPAPSVAPTDFEVEYVVDPMTGYPLVSSESRRIAVRDAYGALRSGASPESVAVRAVTLLEEDPGYHPARVLLAQTDFVARRFAEAAARVRPMVEEMPDYVAAALLRARALERAGEVVEAFAAYRDLADTQSLAAERAGELAERALEIVHRRLDDDLARGRVEDAQAVLARLEEWRPDERATLEARLAVLRAAEDAEGELEVLRRLVTLHEDDAGSDQPYDARDDGSAEGGIEPGFGESSERLQLRLDLAEMEVEVGDLRQGLKVLEVVDPADLEPLSRDRYLEIRDRALFLRRLDLVPPEVAARVEAAELDRADLATLLYWLLPGVRYAPLEDPPIAGDIVDHPQRAAILRILDQHLMRIDETVHRFAPATTATRLEALRGLLAHLASSAPAPSCVDGVRGAQDVQQHTRPWICSRAVRCGLVSEVASCLPSAPLSGAEALEIVRRGLHQLGDSEPAADGS